MVSFSSNYVPNYIVLSVPHPQPVNVGSSTRGLFGFGAKPKVVKHCISDAISAICALGRGSLRSGGQLIGFKWAKALYAALWVNDWLK